MSSWAYVENNEVLEIHMMLPQSWKHISNLYLLENDLDFLRSLGWYPIVQNTISYDPTKQELSPPRFVIDNTVVYEIRDIIDMPVIPEEILINQQWKLIKEQRDQLMIQNDWRYSRYSREIRLGLTPTDTLETIDNYMQALADITKQTDPFNITWPVYNGE
jgi:hypothetical protein